MCYVLCEVIHNINKMQSQTELKQLQISFVVLIANTVTCVYVMVYMLPI